MIGGGSRAEAGNVSNDADFAGDRGAGELRWLVVYLNGPFARTMNQVVGEKAGRLALEIRVPLVVHRIEIGNDGHTLHMVVDQRTHGVRIEMGRIEKSLRD